MADIATVEQPPARSDAPMKPRKSRASLGEALPGLPLTTAVEAPGPRHLYASDQYATVLEYHVDRLGVIQAVPTANAWAAAAKGNGGDLPLHAVLGRSLYQFMSPMLAAFYCELILSLSCSPLHSSLAFRWFCDSPALRREMAIVLINLGETVAFLSVTISETPHDAAFLECVKFVDNAANAQEACAFCNRFSQSGQWYLPEAFSRAAGEAVATPRPLTVCQVTCPDCSDRIVSRLAPAFHKTRRWCTKYASPFLRGGLMLPPTPCGGCPGGRPTTRPASLRVLILDDDMVAARVVEAISKGLGYQTVVVIDPRDVWVFLKDNCVDVILVDVGLAGGPRGDLLRRLVLHPGRTPVVGMSGSLETRDDVRRAGAKDFLQKPVTGQAIQTVLMPLHRQRSPALPSPGRAH